MHLLLFSCQVKLNTNIILTQQFQSLYDSPVPLVAALRIYLKNEKGRKVRNVHHEEREDSKSDTERGGKVKSKLKSFSFHSQHMN